MGKPLILIVEDEIDMANRISKDIKGAGKYETVMARNGKEALDVLNKNKRFLGLAENRIKCIILDLKMPEMNGQQFLRELRKKEPQIELMPVIILSAYEDEEKWGDVTSPSSGLAASYLKKPFNKQELIDTIERVFQGEMGYMIDETREKHYKKLEQYAEEAGKKQEEKKKEEG